MSAMGIYACGRFLKKYKSEITMALNTFNAFKNRNYRLYFAGQSMSLIGTWMQKTAVSWVVYSITHSAFMLGVSRICFAVSIISLFDGGRYYRRPVQPV